MGQTMSSNNDLVHSMKKMRLSNSKAASTADKNVGVVRIRDISSPSSPFRKQSTGEFNILRHAVNAPFENSSMFDSEDENRVVNENNYTEAVDGSREFGVDIPILVSDLSKTCELLLEKVAPCNDKYSNDELKIFILKQAGQYAKPLSTTECELKENMCYDSLHFKTKSSYDHSRIELFELSDEEIVHYLRSL